MKRIAIAGAGSIGCFVGAALAASGRQLLGSSMGSSMRSPLTPPVAPPVAPPVTLIGRARILDQIRAHGARASDYTGFEAHAPASAFRLSETPDALSDADIICVAVKSGASAEMGAASGAHAKPDAVIVSLQNGVSNAATLSEAAGGRTVVAGMAPYNIVQLGEGRFHRTTSGTIMIGDGAPGLAEALTAPGLSVRESDDIEAVLWGKLVVNLNNALNALAGVPLRAELMNAGWRRLMADQIDEALGVLKAADIAVRPALPIATDRFAKILRLPNPLFGWVAARSLKIDPQARSSMQDDFDAGRLTEIDELQGAIIRLGDNMGRPTPIAQRVYDLVRQAERAGAGSPRLTPAAVRHDVRGQ